MEASVVSIELDVSGLNGELPALGHGVAGIDRQVHDHLLDLSGVGFDRSKISARDHDQVDVFADQAVQHFQVFRDDAVEVDNLRRQHLLAAEGEQLASECSGALSGSSDFLGGPAQRGVGPDTLQEELGVSRDHHEQVVEVMGDAAGEATDGFHLLGLAELLLQGAAFGDVLGEQLEEDGVAVVAEGASGESQR